MNRYQKWIQDNKKEIVSQIKSAAHEFILNISGVDLDEMIIDGSWHQISKEEPHYYLAEFNVFEDTGLPFIQIVYNNFKGMKQKWSSFELTSMMWEAHKNDEKFVGVALQTKPITISKEPKKEVDRERVVRFAKSQWNQMESGCKHVNFLYTHEKKIPNNFKYIRSGEDHNGRFIAAPITSIDRADPKNLEFFGLQKIYEDGSKLFNKHLDKTGHGIVIGEINKQVIFLAEGMADAIALHIATGQRCISFLDINNLKPVIKILRDSFVDSIQIVIVADNDKERVNKKTGEPENIGVIKAKEVLKIKKLKNVHLVVPDIKNEAKVDANDVYTKMGKESLRKLVKEYL